MYQEKKNNLKLNNKVWPLRLPISRNLIIGFIREWFNEKKTYYKCDAFCNGGGGAKGGGGGGGGQCGFLEQFFTMKNKNLHFK